MSPEQLQKIEEFVSFVRSAPVYSGVCCCGDSMENHAEAINCGHTATDQWGWSLYLWLKELDPMIATMRVTP